MVRLVDMLIHGAANDAMVMESVGLDGSEVMLFGRR